MMAMAIVKGRKTQVVRMPCGECDAKGFHRCASEDRDDWEDECRQCEGTRMVKVLLVDLTP